MFKKGDWVKNQGWGDYYEVASYDEVTKKIVVRASCGGVVDEVEYAVRDTASWEIKPVARKHAELIKAWADGAEIEIKSETSWQPSPRPSWYEECEYRIKPAKKDDVVRYGTAFDGGVANWEDVQWSCHNCKFVFDGETGFLKAVETVGPV